MLDNIAEVDRDKLWEDLQDLYMIISDSHVKKGLYGDTATKYDAFNAGAEFGEWIVKLFYAVAGNVYGKQGLIPIA